LVLASSRGPPARISRTASTLPTSLRLGAVKPARFLAGVFKLERLQAFNQILTGATEPEGGVSVQADGLSTRRFSHELPQQINWWQWHNPCSRRVQKCPCKARPNSDAPCPFLQRNISLPPAKPRSSKKSGLFGIEHNLSADHGSNRPGARLGFRVA
jgi:hypothetical protein